MKKILLVMFIATSSTAHAQTITATVTNFGMAPVPAFALKKPAAFFVYEGTLYKGKTFTLGVSPDLGINLTNGQGWFGDTWLSATKSLDTTGRFLASIAVNWSIIFSNQNGTTKSVPYPTERYRFQYIPDKKNLFDIEMWHTRAIPLKDGIRGSYISFQYTRSEKIHAYTLGGNANLFHLDYSDGTKGFAGAMYVSVMHKSGFFIGVKYMHTLNAVHVTHAQNVTIGYTRKLKS